MPQCLGYTDKRTTISRLGSQAMMIRHRQGLDGPFIASLAREPCRLQPDVESELNCSSSRMIFGYHYLIPCCIYLCTHSQRDRRAFNHRYLRLYDIMGRDVEVRYQYSKFCVVSCFVVGSILCVAFPQMG